MNVEGGVPGRLHAGKDATSATFPRTAGDATMERTRHSGQGIHPRCPGRKVSGVTAHYPPLTVEHVDLSDTEFWGWPLADRQAAFAMLRSLDRPPFYAEPEFIFETGP